MRPDRFRQPMRPLAVAPDRIWPPSFLTSGVVKTCLGPGTSIGRNSCADKMSAVCIATRRRYPEVIIGAAVDDGRYNFSLAVPLSYLSQRRSRRWLSSDWRAGAADLLETPRDESPRVVQLFVQESRALDTANQLLACTDLLSFKTCTSPDDRTRRNH